ncbi:MAG: sugar transporter [Sphingobacteriales bacterium]|nr:MAG: sugar transporter [Sphingobacteriales bacterium]
MSIKFFYSFKRILIIVLVCTSLVLSVSCAKRQLNYFSDLPDSSVVKLQPMPQQERIIQVYDRLNITIGGRNSESAAIFNQYGGVPSYGGQISGGGGGGNSGVQDLQGYLVDTKGEIEFPIIGKVRAYQLTVEELKDTLTKLVSPYLKDPLVNVKFYQFKFTVLGEVRSPGTFTLSMQRTTLLDALGAAGDLPRTAKRFDIQIYRDYNGLRTISKLDLKW